MIRRRRAFQEGAGGCPGAPAGLECPPAAPLPRRSSPLMENGPGWAAPNAPGLRMPRYVLAGLVALALLPAPARAQDLVGSPAVRRQQPRSPAPVRARQDNPRGHTSFSLGMVVVSPYDVFSDNIGLLQDSIRY